MEASSWFLACSIYFIYSSKDFKNLVLNKLDKLWLNSYALLAYYAAISSLVSTSCFCYIIMEILD